ALPELQAAGDEAYGVLRDVVALGLDRGELRGGDSDLVSLTCWSLVHGLSTLLSSGAVPPPTSAAAQRELVLSALRLLGRGIAGAAPTP
ncbi:MAG TPA: TetR-like C-terminal domain-containing protein, partial [Polyangia bacterium]|nr:TetR-like C-terminal domain-containing protein [Polyangia bacterium]